jgi:hypothetical protein
MRQKLRSRRGAEAPVHGDPAPIDLTDTARQLALFETGNGWQRDRFVLTSPAGRAPRSAVIPSQAAVRYAPSRSRSRVAASRTQASNHRSAVSGCRPVPSSRARTPASCASEMRSGSARRRSAALLMWRCEPHAITVEASVVDWNHLRHCLLPPARGDLSATGRHSRTLADRIWWIGVDVPRSIVASSPT